MNPQPTPLGSHRLVALIPARMGSKRCPGKNTRLLGGKPLWQWSVDVARESGLFSEIVVSTDDITIWGSAPRDVRVFQRAEGHSSDDAPDYPWVSDVLEYHQDKDIFAILRPTSPFRSVSMLRRAYALLIGSEAHSVRAVQRVTDHPGKMWIPNGRFLKPVMDGHHADGTPWHSSPTQTLPLVYKQTASLEMGWVSMVRSTRTIAGYYIAPFLVDDMEGFDINTEADFARAEQLAHDREGGLSGGGSHGLLGADGKAARPDHLGS